MTPETKTIQPAERLSHVSEYYFSRKGKEVARLNAEGRDIISLAIGSPDMPPSEATVETLCREVLCLDCHRKAQSVLWESVGLIPRAARQ